MPRPQSHFGRSAWVLALALAFSVMPVVAQPETGLDTKPDPPPPSATASTTDTVSRQGDSPPLTDIQSTARQDPPAPETTATTKANTTTANTTSARTETKTTAKAKPTTDIGVDETPGFTVIINASNPTTQLPRKSIAKLFLKKIKKWDGWNQSVLPVDHRDDAKQRVQFTDAVHGMRVGSIKEYWTRMIFSGRGAPPRKLSGDAAVVAFVAKTPGAIGYVSATATLDARVKPLTISD